MPQGTDRLERILLGRCAMSASGRLGEPRLRNSEALLPDYAPKIGPLKAREASAGPSVESVTPAAAAPSFETLFRRPPDARAQEDAGRGRWPFAVRTGMARADSGGGTRFWGGGGRKSERRRRCGGGSGGGGGGAGMADAGNSGAAGSTGVGAGREARGAETVEPAAWAAWRRESTTGRPTEAGLTEADSAPVGAERWFEVGDSRAMVVYATCTPATCRRNRHPLG
jgi:hypothetical protein